MPTEILPAEQYERLIRGTRDERLAVLGTLDAVKRRQILSVLPPQNFSGSPELQKEAEAARAAEQAERQKEFRKMMPQLNDLLNPEQMNTAIRGNAEQLKDLVAYLHPVRRHQVAAALPPQALAAFPELRRQGMNLRTPQQLPLSDLRAGKILRDA